MKTGHPHTNKSRNVVTARLSKSQMKAVRRAISLIPSHLFAPEEFEVFELTKKLFQIYTFGDWGVIARELVAALYLEAHNNTNAHCEFGWSETERIQFNKLMGYTRAATDASNAAKKIRQAIAENDYKPAMSTYCYHLPARALFR